jgi:DNA repair exonuclease SbcCD ATPase subunit
MSRENYKNEAEEYADQIPEGYAVTAQEVHVAYINGYESCLKAVVAPLEAKLAENEFLKETYSKQIDEMKQNTLSGEERIKRLLAQLSEEQRVISEHNKDKEATIFVCAEAIAAMQTQINEQNIAFSKMYKALEKISDLDGYYEQKHHKVMDLVRLARETIISLYKAPSEDNK